MVQIPCSFLTMEYLVFTQELDLGETGRDLDAQRVVASKMAAFVDLPGASTSAAVESGPLNTIFINLGDSRGFGRLRRFPDRQLF